MSLNKFSNGFQKFDVRVRMGTNNIFVRDCIYWRGQLISHASVKMSILPYLILEGK